MVRSSAVASFSFFSPREKTPILLLRGRLLLDLDLLDGHVRVHGRGLLDGLGQRPIVIDRVSVGLDRDLLLHPGFHHPIALGLVLPKTKQSRLEPNGYRQLKLAHMDGARKRLSVSGRVTYQVLVNCIGKLATQ